MAECLNKIPIDLKEPIELNNGTWVSQISVPCGKCVQCIERRKMEWGFRMTNEMENSKTAYFVTLTYNNEHVPITRYGIKTLTPHKDITELIKVKGKKRRVRRPSNHLVNFFKKLRVNQERSEITIEHLSNNLKPTDRIKYYAAAEYGEERGRPHYHAIIFNASLVNIEKSWTYGETHIVKANEHTISYVMKYLDKHVGKKQDWRKTPEYNSMSEEVGLEYIVRNKSWHKINIDVLYVTTRKGIRIPMPRYYRERIWDETERKLQCALVESVIQEERKEQIKELGANTYNTIQNNKQKYHELKFRKATKKRTID